VLADFYDSAARSADAESDYARLVGSLARQHRLLPLEKDAVAQVIERSARLSGDAAKLTLLVEQIRDLLTEADHVARKDNRAVISQADVRMTIDAQTHRMSRIREQMQESALRDIALIETSGARSGQVNALSYIELAGFAFGRPTRITARVSPGSGKVIDIEREVELGGPIHSKGVLILSGYLSGRYALNAPISLLASLVFEQSYGGVEGDSASSAELYALLSALANVPLRQDLAVTGSVNQYGAVQAIGGVNEKVEGFFDLCSARGLTGTQGVLVPVGNVQHLMLRQDVVDACAAGRFAVFAVATIDEGLSLLTGTRAGERSKDGAFPPGTVNYLVEERLMRFATARRSLVHDIEPRNASA
jgi:predicted ATP-dependent protease